MKTSLTLALLLAGAAPIAPALAQGAAAPFTATTRYDTLGRVTGTISADSDADGADLFATRNSYDPAGRLVKEESGVLAAWQGEAIAPKDWTGFTVHRTIDSDYDAMDRKTKIRVSGVATPGSGLPSGLQTVTQMAYDPVGRLLCTAVRMNPALFASLPASACDQGAEGGFGPDRIVRNSYDPRGQLIAVTEGHGTAWAAEERSLTYSLNGKLTSLTDGEANRTSFEHDGHDRLVRTRFPVAAKGALASSATDYEQYGYDADGNRTSLRKRDGQMLFFSYDALARVYLKDAPAADTGYAYDLRSLQTWAGTIGTYDAVTHAYDNAARPTSSTTVMAGVTRTLTYRHDADGGRTRLTFPDGAAFTYDRDRLGRAATVWAGTVYGNADQIVMRYIYDPAGRLSARQRLGGIGTNSLYYEDGAGRLASLVHNNPVAGTGVTFGLAYNPASQIHTRDVSNDAYAFSAHASGTTSSAANGLNQLTAHAGATLQHDANGNLTFDGATTYAYDAENRLVSATGARNATLRYDPLGRLFEVASGGAVTRFLYDGDALVAEYDAAGTLLKRHLHGDGVDEPIATFDSAGVGLANRRYYIEDHQGTIVGVLRADTGALETANRYDEYGVPQSGNAGRFQYTGQAWLPELGLYQYKARMYAPALGRFMQMDPVGHEDQANLYSYVRNDPGNNTDPSGELAMRQGCGSLTRRDSSDCPSESGWDEFNRVIKKVNDVIEPINVVSGLISLATLGEYTPEQVRNDIQRFFDSPIKNSADVLAAFPVGRSVGAVSGTAAASRGLVAGTLRDITIGRSIRNFAVKGSLSSFASGLIRRGFSVQATRSGQVTNYVRGDVKFTLRQSSRSGPPTADYFYKGNQLAKVRIVP